ncbi:unnamed protein product, partial [Sphacelaria rigidula]
MPTAVPLHDVENAEASASRGQKGMPPPARENEATQGVVVGPPVGDLPSAFAVEMMPMQPQLASGERVGDGELRYPQQSIEDVAMPEGWEVRMDPTTRQRYFVNHRTRTTTWADPRAVEWNRYEGEDVNNARAASTVVPVTRSARRIRLGGGGFGRPFGMGGLFGFALGRGLRGFGG